MTPYYEQDGITIYHGDCREILPTFPDKSFDLVLTDPPYGILGGSKSIGGSNIVAANVYDLSWDVRLPQVEIVSIAALGLRAVVWGGNYYEFPPTNSLFVWDKKVQNGWEDNFSDGEIAWTSWAHPLRIYRQLWMGALRKNGEVRIHPTQKPVDLFRWCIIQSGDPHSILDPFMGSGTTLVAAKQLGRKAVGIEIEEKYCEIAVKRLAQMEMSFAETA